MWPPWRLLSSTWTAHDRPPLAARHRPKRVILTARQPPEPPPARRLGRACFGRRRERRPDALAVLHVGHRVRVHEGRQGAPLPRISRVPGCGCNRRRRWSARRNDPAAGSEPQRPSAHRSRWRRRATEVRRRRRTLAARPAGSRPTRRATPAPGAPGAPARAPRGADPPGRLARLVRSPAPLAVLTAPAGYGKTTLLAQWEKCDARPFIWIDVTEHDD